MINICLRSCVMYMNYSELNLIKSLLLHQPTINHQYATVSYIGKPTLKNFSRTDLTLCFPPPGGIAVYGTPRATIVIEANDGANGIFSFALPLVYNLQEGKRSAIEYVHIEPER